MKKVAEEREVVASRGIARVEAAEVGERRRATDTKRRRHGRIGEDRHGGDTARNQPEVGFVERAGFDAGGRSTTSTFGSFHGPVTR